MQPGCTNVVKKPEKMAYRKELAVIEILETKGFVKKKKKKVLRFKVKTLRFGSL